jgi:hypothetical protein
MQGVSGSSPLGSILKTLSPPGFSAGRDYRQLTDAPQLQEPTEADPTDLAFLI